MKQALILGATGLVGQHVLQLLLTDNNYDKVTILVRDPVSMTHPKLVSIVLDDFSKMADMEEVFAVDDVFCCLGTTIKKARTKEKFKQVDFSFPLLAAQMSKAMKAKRFLLVSALGANASSSVFYNRVKGELEKAVQELNLPSFLIFRPSLLLGPRKEFRLGERLAGWITQPLSFLFAGALAKYRPIDAGDVAKAMALMAQTFLPGTHIFENNQMHIMLESRK
ncbi:oxidoreductase [Ammoniphilus sp. 3BR4]|uniref:oxidoreductase n=1 Tax=Ammoniphilus sp. 3BR4 TaxID=3158265 RepID=UPI0034677098